MGKKIFDMGRKPSDIFTEMSYIVSCSTGPLNYPFDIPPPGYKKYLQKMAKKINK